MVPTILQLHEIEPPAELAAALSPDFLSRLVIANLPPVQIATLERWGGYCHNMDATERGEVIISDWRIPQPEWLTLQRIQGTYIHEAAHRLIWQANQKAEGHGVEFFTLQLFLFLLAGEKKDGLPWLATAELYDCQDCIGEESPTLGQVVDFSLTTAFVLSGQEITAEQAAAEICRRAKVWREEIVAAPARREAAQKAMREKFETLHAALRSARDKIFWWRYFSVILAGAGFLVGAIYF
ncbi:MAG: hypothetical protein ACYC2W_13080 [Desulfurivibrionaceae bacterium]